MNIDFVREIGCKNKINKNSIIYKNNFNKKMEVISRYLAEINQKLQTGSAREHSYRPAFQKLIEALVVDIQVINEPAYTGGNAPDFLFKKGETPIAYAECKDIDVDIKNHDVQKQAKRYVDAFGKILLTNYLDFKIINESGDVIDISIAEITGNEVAPRTENFEYFINLIRDYIKPSYRTINSAKKLAEIMASKARLLRDNALASLSENKNSDIYEQYITFKEVLIHDLTEQDFSDMYAQTLVYGLFVARYFDSSLKDFSRYEAQDLLPANNPLLKKFFGHVAGTEYDPKISWLVDSLVEAYASADVKGIMHKEFERKQKDPVLHFYETFLKEYDQDLRKSRGVYYTPEPIVSFIVRSVDQILKTKFNLLKGLADISKIENKTKIQANDARTKDGIKKVSKQIHKVQILDPAAGTGTFLNEVINEIYKNFKGQEGVWSGYVKDDLLPRLHGFELMMASYTMAHLKLGVTLRELGYEGDDRLSVWLTNSLDESVHEVPNLFMSQWLTEESNQASRIKSELPIMVVLGNPPYSISSSNKSDNIQNLIRDYKKDLNERKINLDDDYIKFIRFSENQIEKAGYGIVAMITNNSFINGVTHRQMRKHLMETFDEIYIMDLHGNSKKKETAPDGGKDENVFDIMQGVSINIFVKTGESKKLADVYHAELFGKRDVKYEQLNNFNFEKTNWKKIENSTPYYFFVPKDFSAQTDYDKNFSIKNLFDINSAGIKTKVDNIAVDFDKTSLNIRIEDIVNNKYSLNDIISKFNLNPKTTWEYNNVLKVIYDNKCLAIYDYRPFDYRYIYYDKNFLSRSRSRVMDNFFNKNNVGIETSRIGNYIFVSKNISDEHFISDNSFKFPLYIYHKDDTKTPNLNREIWEKINSVVGETKPENILDYIYAVLHSPGYREKYKEFLKIDFPRVPYPKNKEIFWKLVEKGKELRELHLMESLMLQKPITTFPEGGSNIVNKIKYEGGKVYVNEKQYFGDVPEVAWNFYIGGYQPVQKWLKDRKNRNLSSDDIEHYQKIIVVLNETDKIMKEIDNVLFF